MTSPDHRRAVVHARQQYVGVVQTVLRERVQEALSEFEYRCDQLAASQERLHWLRRLSGDVPLAILGSTQIGGVLLASVVPNVALALHGVSGVLFGAGVFTRRMTKNELLLVDTEQMKAVARRLIETDDPRLRAGEVVLLSAEVELLQGQKRALQDRATEKATVLRIAALGLTVTAVGSYVEPSQLGVALSVPAAAITSGWVGRSAVWVRQSQGLDLPTEVLEREMIQLNEVVTRERTLRRTVDLDTPLPMDVRNDPRVHRQRQRVDEALEEQLIAQSQLGNITDVRDLGPDQRRSRPFGHEGRGLYGPN